MGYNNGYDEGVPPAADIVQLLRHAPRRVHDQELPLLAGGCGGLVRRGGISNSFGRVAEGPVNDYEPILMS